MRIGSEGSWSLRSKSDPRWNANGRCFLVGVSLMPEEAKREIERLKQTLGEEPPDDLTWGCMKD